MGGGGRGWVGGSAASPKRPAKEPGPGMPFLERGGILEASSLLPVMYEVAPTESWLLLFCATLRRFNLSFSLEVVESMLPAGDGPVFGAYRTGGVLLLLGGTSF